MLLLLPLLPPRLQQRQQAGEPAGAPVVSVLPVAIEYLLRAHDLLYKALFGLA